jgi:2-oxo-hept-3-ene-1,7-dioate hydratase
MGGPAALCLILGFCGPASACPDAGAVLAYLEDFRAGKASAGFRGINDASAAACARDRLIEALPAVLGPRVGYKALFTNADAQKRFGMAGPAWGAMFASGMVESGARLPAMFGAKPRYEPDFIVEVKDAGLADAQTTLEALGHISALVPFVELPDIMLAGSPGGLDLVATNAAFRAGVLGPRLPVDDPERLDRALADMEVVVTEERGGTEIGRAPGRVLMEHPLNAAIWLARALRAEGVELRPGDLLSLGGFLASAPTRAGTTIAVRYRGLPGDPAVTAHFD